MSSTGGISSQGAPIILAGGSWTATTGSAMGFNTASGATTYVVPVISNVGADNAGVYLVGSISSGGSAITIRGQEGTGSADSAGIYINAGSSITGAGGDVNITGTLDSGTVGTGQSYRAFRIGSGGAGTSPSISTTGSGNITINANITGSTTATQQQAILLEKATISAVNGNIAINASPISGSEKGFLFANGSSSISTSTGTGNITLTSTTSTNGDNFTPASITSGGTLTINSDKPVFDASSTLSATGMLALKPNGTSFSSAVTFPGTWTGISTTGGITIGKSGNTASLTIAAPISAGGDIVTYAGTTTINASSALTTTSSGAISLNATSTYSLTASSSITSDGALTINADGITLNNAISAKGNIAVTSGPSADKDLEFKAGITNNTLNATTILKATRHVLQSTNAVTMQTNKGDLVFWSDSDATTDGRISIYAGSTINTANGLTTTSASGGGKVIMAGGTTTDSSGYPTGYAKTTTASTSGVFYGASSTASTTNYMYTGGGSIRMYGQSSGSGNEGVGIYYGQVIQANAGQIDIKGTSPTQGVYLAAGTTSTTRQQISSSSNVSPAISIDGTSSAATTPTKYGVLIGYVSPGANQHLIQATGTGGITITGSASGGTADIGINAASILS
ncbi:MAG: beta strand repeat-containing protein, partial [Fluviibacter sp.]